MLGLSIGLGFGLTGGNLASDLPRLLVRTLDTLPAVWVMVGLAAALYGWLPRFAAAGTWGALTLFLALELGWELLRISPALFNLSPFAHVHFAVQVTAVSLMALTLVAALLAGAGLAGFQRRDVA